MRALSKRKTYRSPLKKLARFFEKSRDGWKEKCEAAKKEGKALTNRGVALEKSRDRWKALARGYRDEIRQLRQELEEIKSGLRSRSSRPRQCPRRSPSPCRDTISRPA